jgi:hypothetical protein
MHKHVTFCCIPSSVLCLACLVQSIQSSSQAYLSLHGSQGYQTGNREEPGFDTQHVDGSVHQGHDDLVLNFSAEAGVSGPYDDGQGQLKRYKTSNDSTF